MKKLTGERVDYETDNIIQTSIRQELKDVTLITVAHRLQTIMDADRIVSTFYPNGAGGD
jgi:ABC-type multidrug transport system fused ATPase/permease subunit